MRTAQRPPRPLLTSRQGCEGGKGSEALVASYKILQHSVAMQFCSLRSRPKVATIVTAQSLDEGELPTMAHARIMLIRFQL